MTTPPIAGAGVPKPGLGSIPEAPASPKPPKAPASIDGLDAPLRIGSVRRKIEAQGAQEVDAIPSAFPLEDLGQIKTDGRWAQGFRLDSGGLRLMWMTARRTEEKDGTKGFEIFFQAHGPSIDKYKERLTEKGAKNGNYLFEAAEPDANSPPGKSVLKKNGSTWNPSGGTTLNLAEAGKWSVDFVPQQPEALKGAMRIRVLGEDAQATKNLQEVINKLGLHSLFAPPTSAALEKLKLFRLLWQVAPQAADKARWRSVSEVKDDLASSLEAAGLEAHGTDRQAITKANLSSDSVKKRLRLAELLLSKSPRAFLDWVKQDAYSTNGILPTSSGEYYLDNALTQLGIKNDSKEYTDAIAKEPPTQEEARPILELGLLAKKDFGAAEKLLSRDVEAIKTEHLEQALAAAGIDPKGDRVKSLRFEEVYPGYFTVIDPSLPDILKEAGARYLYSTSDNPERVWQQLTGGQKASLTRFQEGMLIQGKSSSSDFGTGGAFSVFTRLVTESVIQKAKTSTDAYAYDVKFGDWGGTRPFKLILNRRILGRTDWYGYNGDNFGRSTGLTEANKSDRLIREVNTHYSASNELMFPVGNDGAYVDFVVCPSEQHKKDLIDFLKSKGIESWNGKPLDKFIRIEVKFFEHPDDMTLPQAIRDAIHRHGFAEAMKKADAAARESAGPVIDQAAQQAAKKTAEDQAKSNIKSYVDYYAQNAANTAAQSAVQGHSELLQALGLEAAKEPATAAAKEAAKETAKKYLLDPNNFSTYYLTSSATSAVQSKLPAAQTLGLEAGKKAAQESGLIGKTDEASKAKLRQIVLDAIKNAAAAKIKELVESEAKPAVLKQAKQTISQQESYIPWQAQTAATEAAKSALLSSANANALEDLEKAALEPARQAAEQQIIQNVKQSGAGWIQWSVQSAASTAAQEIARAALEPKAIETALAAAGSELGPVIEQAKNEFATAYPDKVKPDDEAQLVPAAKAAIEQLAKGVADKIAKEMAPSAAQKYASSAAQEVIAAKAEEIAKSIASDIAAAAAKTAAQSSIQQLASQVGTHELAQQAVKEAADQVREEAAAKLVEVGLQNFGAQNFAYWVDQAAACVDQALGG
jgi:hypothetical protein